LRLGVADAPDQFRRRTVLEVANTVPDRRARRLGQPAFDQDLVDRGLDISAPSPASKSANTGSLSLSLERVEQVIFTQSEVQVGRPTLLRMEPPGHQPRRHTIQLLAGGASCALLVEPSLKGEPGRCVTADGFAVLDRAWRAPDLGALQEVGKVSRDAASELPPRLAAHQTRVASHLVHPGLWPGFPRI
jgi:hypothetical protein